MITAAGMYKVDLFCNMRIFIGHIQEPICKDTMTNRDTWKSVWQFWPWSMVKVVSWSTNHFQAEYSTTIRKIATKYQDQVMFVS